MDNIEKECCTCQDVGDISLSLCEIFERIDALETQVSEINEKMSGITTCMARCVKIFELSLRGK